MATMTKDQMLLEFEKLIRDIPSPQDFLTISATVSAWSGALQSVVSRWNPTQAILLSGILAGVARSDFSGAPRAAEYNALAALLYRARHDLQIETGHSTGVAFEPGAVFEYFTELTSKIAMAHNDILFVDPYLDPEFAANYLPQISSGVSIRLLMKHKPQAMAPAVQMFNSQHAKNAQLREATTIHDRFVFIDGQTAFQSGASFKDGARNSATALIEVVDVFRPIWQHYEQLWANATVHV